MRKIFIVLLPAAFAAMLTACGVYGEGSDTAETVPSTVTYKSIYYTASAVGEAPPVSSETVSETVSDTVTTETTAETEPETEQTTALPFEDTPENAYIRLNSAFDTENNGTYPDDYSGSYSYGGTLFVAITTYSPSDFYRDLLSEYTCVRYVTVSKSLNELTEIGRRAAELLEPEFGVYEYFADVPSNKAAVSILSGDPKAAQNFLKTVPDAGFYLEELEISMADVPASEADNEE
ncbi:MAG: hypothetical protein NC120_00045 [Ruminococcus sp.]|nr:hypothetical protein [Ruminococcus sp.]